MVYAGQTVEKTVTTATTSTLNTGTTTTTALSDTPASQIPASVTSVSLSLMNYAELTWKLNVKAVMTLDTLLTQNKETDVCPKNVRARMEKVSMMVPVWILE